MEYIEKTFTDDSGSPRQEIKYPLYNKLMKQDQGCCAVLVNLDSHDVYLCAEPQEHELKPQGRLSCLLVPQRKILYIPAANSCTTYARTVKLPGSTSSYLTLLLLLLVIVGVANSTSVCGHRGCKSWLDYMYKTQAQGQPTDP